MSPRSWQAQLRSKLSGNGRVPRLAIVGVGNEMRGDDGTGMAVVRDLGARLGADETAEYLLVRAQNAPESHTGPIRRFAPELVLFVDVAWLGETPGTIRLLPWEQTSGLSASTHTFPLHLLANYLNHETGCDVLLLGIQPGPMELGLPLSPAAAAAAREVAAELARLLTPAP